MIAALRAELVKLRRRRVLDRDRRRRRSSSPSAPRRSCSPPPTRPAEPSRTEASTVESLSRTPAAAPRCSRPRSPSPARSCSSSSSASSRSSSRAARSGRCSCTSRAGFVLLAGKMAGLLVLRRSRARRCGGAHVDGSEVFAPIAGHRDRRVDQRRRARRRSRRLRLRPFLGQRLRAARHDARRPRALRAGRAGDRDRLGGPVRAHPPGRLEPRQPATSRDYCSRPSWPAARQRCSATRAFLTVAVYVTLAAAIAATVFSRRDVTA